MKRELLLTEIAQREYDLNEIWGYIRKTWLPMCWGAKDLTWLKNTVLAFKVNWFEHKGWVYISLDWDDTFTITLTKLNRTTIVKQIKWVYIDQLISTLDTSIEKAGTDAEYKSKVQKAEYVF